MKISVRPRKDDDSDWITKVLLENWASNIIVTRGISYKADLLEGYIAEIEGERVGLLTYSIKDDELEIITLNAIEEGKGVGTALIEEVEKLARMKKCSRIWLITTNDNVDALRFYQKREYEIISVHRYAIEESRKIKPQLPFVGKYGIPIRDEIEMEKIL
ncbi:MAG: GNAT family N-acetyltransferase [Candidatus Thorarchaeota archaeon]|nr:MAG: GNAT family N-acetyltransferase [Candidatus Thorarchaeota archaeon]